MIRLGRAYGGVEHEGGIGELAQGGVGEEGIRAGRGEPRGVFVGAPGATHDVGAEQKELGGLRGGHAPVRDRVAQCGRSQGVAAFGQGRQPCTDYCVRVERVSCSAALSTCVAGTAGVQREGASAAVLRGHSGVEGSGIRKHCWGCQSRRLASPEGVALVVGASRWHGRL